MPLNAKGKKIKAAMEKEYGKEHGDRVFYASEHKGTIHAVKKATGETEHHVHHVHSPGSVVHHHHHYSDGVNVVHHHYMHDSMKMAHKHHPVEGSAEEETAETTSQEERETKAKTGLKAAFPGD
jgi:hypothetical protein